MTDNDKHHTSIRPCELCMPKVEAQIAEACAAWSGDDITRWAGCSSHRRKRGPGLWFHDKLTQSIQVAQA